MSPSRPHHTYDRVTHQALLVLSTLSHSDASSTGTSWLVHLLLPPQGLQQGRGTDDRAESSRPSELCRTTHCLQVWKWGRSGRLGHLPEATQQGSSSVSSDCGDIAGGEDPYTVPSEPTRWWGDRRRAMGQPTLHQGLSPCVVQEVTRVTHSKYGRGG